VTYGKPCAKEPTMLSREEVERRLACSFPADHSNEVVALMGGFEREALQTAQSLFAERDEPKGQCVRWEAMYEGMMAERDGLTEDVERLRGECERLTRWLRRIDGGDTPCQDESQLRQWAYEAITLGRDCE
jgi:hypothetical protein